MFGRRQPNQPYATQYTVKKKLGDFLVPSRDVTNQTISGRDNYIVPRLGEFGSCIPARDGKIADVFLQCRFFPTSYNFVQEITKLHNSES